MLWEGSDGGRGEVGAGDDGSDVAGDCTGGNVCAGDETNACGGAENVTSGVCDEKSSVGAGKEDALIGVDEFRLNVAGGGEGDEDGKVDGSVRSGTEDEFGSVVEDRNVAVGGRRVLLGREDDTMEVDGDETVDVGEGVDEPVVRRVGDDVVATDVIDEKDVDDETDVVDADVEWGSVVSVDDNTDVDIVEIVLDVPEGSDWDVVLRLAEDNISVTSEVDDGTVSVDVDTVVTVVRKSDVDSVTEDVVDVDEEVVVVAGEASVYRK